MNYHRGYDWRVDLPRTKLVELVEATRLVEDQLRADLREARLTEHPTERAIPRAPRVPVFEVRYDLAEASDLALRSRGRAEKSGPASDAVYAGLTSAEMHALAEARCEMIQRARQLGWRA